MAVAVCPRAVWASWRGRDVDGQSCFEVEKEKHKFHVEEENT